MKTIEQKAKRYDDLLVKLQKAKVDNDVCDERYCCVIDNIVPELKESEDEKIKGKIIATIHLYYGEPLEDEAKEMVAWLEKQGEQKPVPKFKVGDVIRLKGTAAEYTIKRVTDTTYYTDGWSCGIERCEEDYEFVEHKPAVWSEKDETTKNNISHIIRQYDKISKRENQPCYYVGDCLLWMQNIKDRVQPKQEWSEEDKTMLCYMEGHLEYLKNDKGYSSSEDQIMLKRQLDWLKSLRPQSKWKPSEEQMDILKLSTYCQNEQMSKVLSELYQDLKKLKE